MISFRKCITYPGELSMRLLIWRDTAATFGFILTLPLALLALGLLFFSEYIDNLLDLHYNDSLDKFLDEPENYIEDENDN